MRMLRLLQIALLLSFSVSAAAIAGPVTGQSAVTAYDSAATVYDDVNGGNRRDGDEERSQQTGFDGAALFDGIGMPLLRLSAPVYLQLESHPKLRALGAGGESGDGGGGGGISEGGGGDGIGNVGVTPGGGLPGGGSSSSSIPEPATLFLLGPAVALAVRRRLRRKHARS